MVQKSFNIVSVGVDIIAILESEPVKQIVLVSQFRPPLDAQCIEFPAGLITEMEETPVSAAMRELYVINNFKKLLRHNCLRKKLVIMDMKPK